MLSKHAQATTDACVPVSYTEQVSGKRHSGITDTAVDNQPVSEKEVMTLSEKERLLDLKRHMKYYGVFDQVHERSRHHATVNPSSSSASS